MSKKNPTRQELIKMSEHLHYEIWMFSLTTNALVAGAADIAPIPNVIIESYAIHLRNLISFFYKQPRRDDAKQKRDDSIFAVHYFGEDVKKWASLAGLEPSELLKQAKTKAHRQVAHLSLTRLKKKPWTDLKKIEEEIYGLVIKFMDNVDSILLDKYYDRIKGILSSR